MRALAILFIALALSPACAQHRDLPGRVVGVTDGDTLTLLTPERRQVKVRLAEVDAPELGQPYGNRSKQALSALVFGMPVRVEYVDTDDYGRTVGRVYQGSVDVSAEMIRSGSAWAYRHYLKDKALLALEQEARSAKRGLWGTTDAKIPPWEWRHEGRGEPRTPVQPTFACGSKTYCREMTSCEEATFYLRQCGLTRLDGDGDGVPCENLCR